MNTELPPFKSGKHNSESASTIDRVITLLNTCIEDNFNAQKLLAFLTVPICSRD